MPQRPKKKPKTTLKQPPKCMVLHDTFSIDTEAPKNLTSHMGLLAQLPRISETQVCDGVAGTGLGGLGAPKICSHPPTECRNWPTASCRPLRRRHQERCQGVAHVATPRNRIRCQFPRILFASGILASELDPHCKCVFSLANPHHLLSLVSVPVVAPVLVFVSLLFK